MVSNSGIEHVSPEQTPLLFSSVRAAVDSQAISTKSSRQKPSQLLIIILVLLYVVFLDLGYELIVVANTRVFEAIYCREYYELHDPSLVGSDGRDMIDEKWCKLSVIQGEVAMLKGWQLTLDSIGSEAPNVLKPEF